MCHFNPRPPCGVRPPARARRAKPAQFQSTHPVRGATMVSGSRSFGSSFQSTHPVRGATVCKRHIQVAARISIHAPRAGCDANGINSGWSWLKFQSTHPVRGATGGQAHSHRRGDISIHAPRAGCDQAREMHNASLEQFQSTHPVRGATDCPLVEVDLDGQFQSTHPVRGATQLIPMRMMRSLYFNPRTPCGVRLCRQAKTS